MQINTNLNFRNESPKDGKKDDRPYSEGLKAVEQDGKWGFINQDGALVIPYKYHYVNGFVMAWRW